MLAVRSVQLSADTTLAWKQAGVAFARRGRTTDEIVQVAIDNDHEAIINLGKSEFRGNDASRRRLSFVWNSGELIRPLLYPGSTRRYWGDLMPPQPTRFPAEVWIKAPGMKGKGKYRKDIDRALTLPTEWDWQVHVEGQEYRLITVGERVVQSYEKYGTHTERDYKWVGLQGTPPDVKELAREAARRLAGPTVVGWDLVKSGDNVYLFEGNSCPGVNEASAKRIVTEIRRQMEEANA